MFDKLRKAIYDFVGDDNKRLDPVEQPDIGVVGFDDGVTHGEYTGNVSMPPATGVTDATALALLLSAQWVSAFAEKRGMTRTVLKTGDYKFVVKWNVEFTQAEVSDDAIVADPEGIRAAIESLIESADPEPEPDQEPKAKEGVVISIHGPRNRLRREDQ